VEPVSVLQLAAIAGGIGFAVVAAWNLRRVQRTPFPIVAAGTTAVALLLVGVFPETVSLAARALAVGSYPGSRLLTLLILAVAAVWTLVLVLGSRQRHLERGLDVLMRREAVAELDAPDPPLAGTVLCIIPALDEAANLPWVLDRMPREAAGLSVRVLVVDDGSTDETRRVAREHGALTIRDPEQRGGGAALRAGFDVARAHDVAVAVTLDADGQNDPVEMPPLVEPLAAGRADIVIGSRILGRHENTKSLRHAGVVLFSRTLNVLMGTRVTDIASGFRAARTPCLARLPLRQDQYHTSEFLVMAAKTGLRITEVPITFKRRLSGTSRKGPELLYGLRFTGVLVGSWLRVR